MPTSPLPRTGFRRSSVLIALVVAIVSAFFYAVPSAYACYTWQVGNRVGLRGGAQIRHGPGNNYAVHTTLPADANDWPVDIIGGPRSADGHEWWDISRVNIDGGGTGWVSISQAGFNVCSSSPPPPAPSPGQIYVAQSLELRADPSGNWPPPEGDKLIGRFTLGNNGGQTIRLEGYGVRMRRNGSDYWDFLYPGSARDLQPGETVRFDQNNERPLIPGRYRAEITWRLAGQDWQVTQAREFDVVAKPNPGQIYIAANLELHADPSGIWPPPEGNKLVGRFTLGNNGGQSVRLEGYGVRMRRNGDDYWDFLYPGSARDLAPGETVRFDQNNERPLIPGRYRAEITWKLAGQDWQVTQGREFEVVTQASPGQIHIAQGLELHADPSGIWPPPEGNKLVGRFTLGNNGGQTIRLDGYGVRLRRNGDDYWDFLYPGSARDLAPGETVRFDQNNERPLTSGRYGAEITWKVAGQDWQVAQPREFVVGWEDPAPVDPGPVDPVEPAPTYVIAGQITGSDLTCVAGVTITYGSNLRTTTTSTGNYLITGLRAGTYQLVPSKEVCSFSPLRRTVTVPPNTNGQNFSAGIGQSPPPQETGKPPLLVVHGIQLLSLSHSCPIDGAPAQYIEIQDGDPQTNLAELPRWFTQDYDVWMAYLDSTTLHTPTLERNANCLHRQINYLYEKAGKQKITIVAHSMGGLVSRACLSNRDCAGKVKALYTLGSPHGGLNLGTLLKLVIALKYSVKTVDAMCMWQPALCQFGSAEMAWFNSQNPNQSDIQYTFIGGRATPWFPGWILWPTEGANDGIVGGTSSIGWTPRTNWYVPVYWPSRSLPYQYWTDEVHVPNWGHAYHASRRGTASGYSQSYHCIRYQMGMERGKPGYCQNPHEVRIQQDDVPTLNQTSTSVAGLLEAGQSITRSISVDAEGMTVFLMAWSEGTLEYSLVNPHGGVITPEYAMEFPEEVAYTEIPGSTEFLPMAKYLFTETLAGEWQVAIRNPQLQDIGYAGFAAFQSGREFTVTQDSELYSIGDTALITASLQEDGVGISELGATVAVFAEVELPDGLVDLVQLEDAGAGFYQARYEIPDIGGRVLMTVRAVGSLDGVEFSRQVERVWAIASPDADFTASSADSAQDTSDDGLFDVLLVDVELDVVEPAGYLLAARLQHNGIEIAGAATYTDIVESGVHTVTLAFSGADIRAAELDGPYEIGQGVLTNVSIGSVTIAERTLVHVTAPYRWDEFGPRPSRNIWIPALLGQ